MNAFPESQDLKDRFTKASDRLEKAPNEFERTFEAFRVAFRSVERVTETEARYAAPRFNLFQLLGVQHREEKTHSALLAELLNPNGRHGQQFLFLESFLAICRTAHPGFPAPARPLPLRGWKVQTELHTLEGNLDIVIRNHILSFVCVIENKIYASDQKEQLDRYASWLKRQPEKGESKALIYLTPFGVKAPSAETIADEDYFRLAYRTHIVNWLEKVHQHILAERVRVSVDQYLDVIRTL